MAFRLKGRGLESRSRRDLGQVLHSQLPVALRRETLTQYPWRLVGKFVVFCPKGCGFESHSSRHVGTLGKFLTRNCQWRFGVKLRHSILAVSGTPLSSSGLEEAL